MQAGGLNIKLMADIMDLQSKMDQAQRLVSGAVGSITQAFTGMGAQITAALSLAGLSAWVKGAIDAADEMSKLAQKAGVSVEQVAGLQLAFQQSGVSAEQFVPIMAKLGVAATNGSKALDAMGVSSRNADGSLKSTRELLAEVSDKFAGYQDGAAKTALAVGLLGEEGAKLLPLLNGGAAALDEFDAMALRLGLTIDEQTAKSAEAFNDTLDLMAVSSQGVARQVAAQLLPTLTTLAGELFNSATQGDTLKNVSNALAGALKALYSVGVGVVQVFKTVGTALGGFGAAVAAILRGDFGQVRGIIDNMRDDISASWADAGRSITAVWEGAGNSTVAAMAEIVKREAPAVAANEKIKNSVERITEAEKELADIVRMQRKNFMDQHEAWEKEREAQEQALQDEIKLRRQLQADRDNAIVEQGVREREIMDEVRARELADYQKHWDQISQAMVDSLMQGGKSFKEYLVGLFRTIVLRPVISGVVGAGLSMAGFSGPANAASGGMSSLGTLGNIASGVGSISSFGAGIMSGLSEAALGASFVGPSASLAAGATGAGASVGSALSAIPGWGWAAAGVLALLGSGIGKTPGEQHTGGFYSSAGNTGMDAALGITGGNDAYARDLIKRANPEIESMVGNVVDSVIKSTTAQAKALGMDIAVGIDAGFAVNTNGQGANKNAFGYFDVTINGETVAEYVNRTLGEDVTQATAQWTSDMTDAVAEWVLGGKNVIKSGETAGQAMARLSTHLTAVNSTFDVLGFKMFDASVEGAALASSLVDAFGSLERFTNLTGQFYQSYYSDSERFATSQRLLRDQFAALNLTMPDSTASFRAMVESALAAGDSGLAASLLELGPAFYAVASAVESVFNSISVTTAQSVRDIEMSVMSDAEKYAYLDREIEGYITKLSTATLPEEIDKLFGQINSSTMAAWNLLSPEQQRKLRQEFIDRLYEAEAIAQSRLSVTGNQTATTVERQAEAVATQMEAAKIQRDAAASMLTAATEMRQAAEKMVAAANTPLVVAGSGGSGSGGREVSYS